MAIDNFIYDAKYSWIFTRSIPSLIAVEINPCMTLIPKDNIAVKNLVIFDVGANLGLWTAALLNYYGLYVHEVHLFEPLAGNVAKIEEHLRAGIYEPWADRVKLNACAASSRNGESIIRSHAPTNRQSGYASLSVQATQLAYRSIPLSHSTTIKTIKLDDYVLENEIDHIDIAKLDVEGHELEVLRGLEHTIRQQRVLCVIYEFGTHQMGDRNYFRDFWDFFDKYGYTQYRFRPQFHDAVKIDKYRVGFEDFSQVHMFAAVATS